MVAQIGELSRRVSIAVKSEHPDVPWATISGMRNRIYNDYGAFDTSVLAETVRKDLPALAQQLKPILGSNKRARPS